MPIVLQKSELQKAPEICNADRVRLNELEALTILIGTPHLGPIKVRLLLQQYGSALEAIEHATEGWTMLPGFGSKIISGWKDWYEGGRWEQNLELVSREGAEIIPYTSPKYPKRLLEIRDHPLVLYVKGELKTADQRNIAVIGTRAASIYGLEMAEKLTRELVHANFTITSGLARGIDTKAHTTALEEGRTIAVIGSGLCNIYPKENEVLAKQIAAKGAIISEYAMMTPPDRQHFPQRNRIVSGMAAGIVLIEAPKESGAMITMQKGLEQGRKLFAIPGRADNPNFRGNHWLLKENIAHLVEEGQDIAVHYDSLFSTPACRSKTAKKPTIALEREEAELLSILPNEELSIDRMVEMSKLPIMKINILLMSLVLKGAIREYPGKIYKKSV